MEPSEKSGLDAASTARDTLHAFFRRLNGGQLLHEDIDPGEMEQLRTAVRQALFHLLLAARDHLDRREGLQWPYEQLQRGAVILEQQAEKGRTPMIRRQAGLFLSLLPFPGQWQRLLNVPSGGGMDSEMERFLADERRRIAAKLKKKEQKRFKLRHFCQVLKAPNLPGEKGILRIFSLPYLFTVPGLLEAIGRQYVVYLEPPWGVMLRHAWLRVFAALPDPVIIGACGAEDRRFLAGQAGVHPVRLAHGDFLEADETVSRPERCRYDIVFNGTFDEMARKRHRFLLDSLLQPPLREATALFIGRGRPEAVARFEDEIRARHLAERTAVRANLLRKAVPTALATARVCVHISLNENGPRSIYEALRADLPCVVTRSMAGFDFEVITPRTGCVTGDEGFPKTVREVLDHPGRFRPREWFLSRGGSRHSSRRLNRMFQEFFRVHGYGWTTDIAPLGSSGANRYAHAADYRRFRPLLEDLLAMFRRFHPLPVRLERE